MYLGTYRPGKMKEKSMAKKVSKKEKLTWVFWKEGQNKLRLNILTEDHSTSNNLSYVVVTIDML